LDDGKVKKVDGTSVSNGSSRRKSQLLNVNLQFFGKFNNVNDVVEQSPGCAVGGLPWETVRKEFSTSKKLWLFRPGNQFIRRVGIGWIRSKKEQRD